MKYYDYAVTFAEFPDEVALCFNISNCPGRCKKCSEPWLLEDVGTEMTEAAIDAVIEKSSGITLVGFMGGDKDHNKIEILSKHIHEKFGLKVGMYSGQEYLDMNLLGCLDYYKIGRWILPEGPVEEWHKKNCGPLKFPFSNQLMFKKDGDKWINITGEFRKDLVNNYAREIIV